MTTRRAVHLTVRIPQFEATAFPAALNLARSAPAFEVEGQEDKRFYVATFDDLPRSIDLAVQLVGEAVNVPSVRVTINERDITRVGKFWTALLCYRESLHTPDPLSYCVRQAARISDAAGCPDRTCLSHCPFICTRCLEIARESGSPPVAAQLLEIARRAEVEWCPNLTLPTKP